MEVNQVHAVHFQEEEDKTQPKPLASHLEAWPPSRKSAALGNKAQGSGFGAVLWELTHIIRKGALEPVKDKPALLP